MIDFERLSNILNNFDSYNFWNTVINSVNVVANSGSIFKIVDSIKTLPEIGHDIENNTRNLFYLHKLNDLSKLDKLEKLNKLDSLKDASSNLGFLSLLGLSGLIMSYFAYSKYSNSLEDEKRKSRIPDRKKLIENLAHEIDTTPEKMKQFIDNFQLERKELHQLSENYDSLKNILESLSDEDIEVFNRDVQIFNEVIQDEDYEEKIRLLLSYSFFPKLNDIVNNVDVYLLEDKIQILNEYNNFVKQYLQDNILFNVLNIRYNELKQVIEKCGKVDRNINELNKQLDEYENASLRYKVFLFVDVKGIKRDIEENERDLNKFNCNDIGKIIDLQMKVSKELDVLSNKVKKDDIEYKKIKQEVIEMLYERFNLSKYELKHSNNFELF